MANSVTHDERRRVAAIFHQRAPSVHAYSDDEHALLTKVFSEDVGGFVEQSDADRRATIVEMHASHYRAFVAASEERERRMRATFGTSRVRPGQLDRHIATWAAMDVSERNTSLLSLLVTYPTIEARLHMVRKVKNGGADWMDARVLLDAFADDDNMALDLIELCSAGVNRPRDTFVSVIAKVVPSMRLRALKLMMHATSNIDDLDYMAYAMVDWPCRDDVAFLVSVMGCLIAYAHRYEFVCMVVHDLCPPSNLRSPIPIGQYETVLEPIMRATHPTYRFRVAHLLLGIMDSCTTALRDAICRDFPPTQREANDLTQFMKTHNTVCVMHSLRGRVAAKRDAIKQAPTPVVDIKLDTELDPATQQLRIKKKLEALACVICFENARRVRFDPCGHVICCSGCYSRIHACPSCRAPIESVAPCFM